MGKAFSKKAALAGEVHSNVGKVGHGMACRLVIMF
jgi:hypothetical protein